MEMENHHQYGGGISDLRQFISIAAASGGAPHFPTYGQQPQPQQQPSLLSDFMTAHNHHPYNNNNSNSNTNGGMVVMGRHMGTSSTGPHPQNHYQDHFNCDSATTTTTATTVQGNPFDCGDGGTARWPRQETLTLLEIRSRLDHKFKEANQKGPLWDEVARIMCEEHGYQRSGKKCREKFENLYKYYKKTKEGKAGRQDGKHYRFFRQLEALYGEHNHPISTSEAQNPENAPQFHNTHPLIPPQPTSLVPPPSRGCDTSVSLSNSSNFETSSSDDEDGSMESNGSMETQKKKKKKRRGHSSNWKAKIKEFIDLQMMKIMEKQESWLEKMMNTLENRESERMIREEEWRKQEVERVEREHKFWASERAWIEARDSALMAALEKLTNNNNDNNNNHNNNNDGVVHHQWPEHEVTRLIQVRTSMESRFQQCGFSEEVLWEDIATKMAYLGYDRSAIVCKEKWDNINNYFRGKSMLKDEGKKKRKENYGGIIQHHHHNLNTQSHNHSNNEGGIYMNQLSGFNNCEINEPIRLRLNEGSSSPSSHNSNVNANTVNAAGNVMNDSCLRFFLGDHGESNLGWESNYGLKLNNGDNHCS
ncbi:trihelix transcription factor PTL-like [Silene latifolia]|uniref:trihelix transcription factor PTL-like n=1 Tax=Silene latifolia TaxID=37657 RepID=UPI003D783BA8